MRTRNLAFLALAAALAMALWGCGSNRDSDGDTTGQGTTLADANILSITNCLTCHNQDSAVTSQWLASRHANNVAPDDRVLQDLRDPANPALPDPDEDPDPNNTNPTCEACHNPIGDGQLIPAAIPGETARMLIGCESCHGGGQFHNGIAAGIPFPSPGPEQCGKCHGINGQELFHGTSGSGNNIRRNMSDTHVDNPATSYQSSQLDPTDPQFAPNIVEGYVVKTGENDGCSVCHGAHQFDVTINLQWARSPHSGFIKDVKDQEMFDQLDAGATAADTLAAVKAVGASSASGDAWVHYDWDAQDRQSCQRCHTSTGLMNFLADTAGYDTTANDFSHLAGWSKAKDGTVTSSGQNELLYCWGCHSDAPNGVLRDDPNGITLDFVNESPDSQSGQTEFVVLPKKGNSDVCGACHAGRGNNTSIRTGNRSSRFAGHHGPTAGSLYAATTHTGFEYTGQDYSAPFPQHENIGGTADGPCVSCHMSGSANHNFLAVTEDEATGDITAINNQALCDECHGAGGMTPATLNTLSAQFEDARQILLDLASNTVPNYLNADLTKASSATAVPPRATGYDNAPLDAYGAFQNSLYMNDEPCIFVHNTLYGKRLIFDSIDQLQHGMLTGSITIDNAAYPLAANWLGDGSTRP